MRDWCKKEWNCERGEKVEERGRDAKESDGKRRKKGREAFRKKGKVVLPFVLEENEDIS